MRRLTTETGAGQWGTALAFACAQFGLECEVWQVGASYDQKPYRRIAMETYGATVHRSPSELTAAGRSIRAGDARHPGSLGIAISEAVEVAAQDPETRYALGSVLNHVLLHQTVIGEEALLQFAAVGEVPDVIVGCTGGGSNFGGLAFPFLREKLAGRMAPVIRAVEPASCPSLTRGIYTYDFGDTAGMTPLMKMHTLGHDFVPDPIHAGGLRYHGMSPLLSHVYELGLIEALALPQTECFAAGAAVRPHRGHHPGARAHARGRRLHPRGAGLPGERRGEGDPHRAVRARALRHARLRGLPGRRDGRRGRHGRAARALPRGAAARSRLSLLSPRRHPPHPARQRACRVPVAGSRISSSRGGGPSVRPVGGLRLPARYCAGQVAPGPVVLLLGGGVQRPVRVVQVRAAERAQVGPAGEQDRVDVVVGGDGADRDHGDPERRADLVADPVGVRRLVAAAEGRAARP